MKKSIFLSVIFFLLGFFAHAFFFPEFLSNGISDVSTIALPLTEPNKKSGALRELTTKIYFDGERFNRHNITIEVGTYLMIINSSPDKLMSLVSNYPQFVTPRGYGKSETVQDRIETPGQYVVADKNNPQEKLVVTVK